MAQTPQNKAPAFSFRIRRSRIGSNHADGRKAVHGLTEKLKRPMGPGQTAIATIRTNTIKTFSYCDESMKQKQEPRMQFQITKDYLLNYQSESELSRNVLFFKDHDICFLSVPKSGCSSIKSWYAKYYGVSIGGNGADIHDPTAIGFDNLTKLGIAEVCDRLSRKDIWKFCIIRDPTTRALSGYLDKILHSKPDTFRVFAAQLGISRAFKMSIEELEKTREQITFQRFLELVNDQPILDRNEHWRNQSALCFDLSLPNISAFLIDDLTNLSISLSSHFGENIGVEKYAPHATNADQKLHLFLNTAVQNLIEQTYGDDLSLFNELRLSATPNNL